MAVISKKARSGIDIKGLTVKTNDQNVVVSGKNGSTTVMINEGCQIDIKGDVCFISNENNKIFAGTDFSNINRAVTGLNKVYKEEINIKGSGFKVVIQPKQLTFSLGFSHSIIVNIPESVTVVQDTTKKSTTKENILTLVLTSKDINIITKFADELSKLRKYNPYKKTGIIRAGKYMPSKKSSKGSGGKGGK